MALYSQPYALQLSALSARVSPAPLVRAAVGVAYALMTWDEAYRTRQTLKHLTEDQLKDIGLTRAETFRESQRGFWQH
ncbi:MAG: DUF1127 domain-containing protein [Litoreibacter sp.]